ncbi:HlyD family efflux transporter periplasmic adaptor subunit [Caenimonas sedimenti]|nr:HlyD family efflux transporter periplasmic adaptor subunit [Caenimonas sedimenti]
MNQTSPLPLPAADAASARPGLLQALAALLAGRDLRQGADALAVELAQLLQCTQVALALRGAGPGDLALAGSSLPTELDPRHDSAVALLAAMHEAADQGQAISWPAAASLGAAGPVAQAQRQLAGTGAAVSVPLVTDGRIVGVVTLVRGERPFDAAEIRFAEDAALLCAPVLELQRRLALPWHGRMREWARGDKGSRKTRPLLFAGVALAAALLAVPVPWRVSAPAKLEGSVQRAVVAATDGFLQQSNVRPGDRVREGQVLAELASQDLELERRRRESEVQHHETSYRAAQARYDRTLMVASQAKAAEASAMLSLAEAQLQRAKVTAPFDGIVIKGDLTQTLGAPVQRGEVLMVLAPDEGYRLMLEVDETDIRALSPGQRGDLVLSAQPGTVLPFIIRRIVPVATAADGRNFFEVEAQLQGKPAALRPGLSGVAKVETGTRSIASLLTYRAWNWLRVAWWRLTP